MSTELVPAGLPAGELVIPTEYSDADWTLGDDTASRVEDAIPESTRRVYVWAVREFVEWCATMRRVPLPATPQTLTGYVDYMIESLGRAPASVTQAIFIIRAWHSRKGYKGQPDATDARLLLRGYRRRLADQGVGQKQAIPLTKESLYQCIDTLDLDSLAGRRDQVAIVFGFRMYARRHVLAALRFADVEDTPDGLNVHIRADKSDKMSEGRVCSLPPLSRPDGDPVRVLRAWRTQLEAVGASTDGPLLCRFTRSGRPLGPLSGQSINAIVKRLAKNAGLPDAERYSGHSLRAGGLVDALQRGVPPGIAARHGGWAPESPMLGRYSRVANRWRDNALIGAE